MICALCGLLGRLLRRSRSAGSAPLLCLPRARGRRDPFRSRAACLCAAASRPSCSTAFLSADRSRIIALKGCHGAVEPEDQPVTLSRKWRSWVTMGWRRSGAQVASSRLTDSASRWMMGSSSGSRSGYRKRPAERDPAPLAAGQLATSASSGGSAAPHAPDRSLNRDPALGLDLVLQRVISSAVSSE